jgi:hypothetical protein
MIFRIICMTGSMAHFEPRQTTGSKGGNGRSHGPEGAIGKCRCLTMLDTLVLARIVNHTVSCCSLRLLRGLLGTMPGRVACGGLPRSFLRPTSVEEYPRLGPPPPPPPPGGGGCVARARPRSRELQPQEGPLAQAGARRPLELETASLLSSHGKIPKYFPLRFVDTRTLTVGPLLSLVRNQCAYSYMDERVGVPGVPTLTCPDRLSMCLP